MGQGLQWCAEAGRPARDGRLFDPWRLRWEAPSGASGAPVDASAALRRLAARGGLRRVPVGVIGPREASEDQMARARAMGAGFAQHGLQLLCGGKNGVMEAACRGHLEEGGLPVGLLPDEEWDAANPYVAIPVATGIGPARNAIIARACVALVAIGGGVGTLSEIALALQFRRLVLAMPDAPQVEGAIAVASVEEAVARIAQRILALDAPASTA